MTQNETWRFFGYTYRKFFVIIGTMKLNIFCHLRSTILYSRAVKTPYGNFLQADVGTYYTDKDENIADSDKFDVVYDAATASGAGEDYKDRVTRGDELRAAD